MRTEPLQNRVTPEGRIIAVAARGGLMGNRGILHDAAQRLGTARWRHRNWIACRLEFRGRHRAVMQPGRYTELFFLDEAVSLAAGHRPCAECRRADYERFRDAWQEAFGTRPGATEIDGALHIARVRRNRAQITHEADMGHLPEGTFIHWAGAPHLVLRDRLLPYAPEGYGAPAPRPASGRVTVLTPRPCVAVLVAGYRPALHSSAE
ncbi:hypothetical protein DDZ14_09590 [Maritimibacter sp. 55A14]|uniref:hypothetical protein n=1 Tax=Maritimibacter sp. 55A14 TaxID=2174844 RepID=UPI000D610A5F|nr:hypothetical protein [Maritimibacter sp. 55A14]PWE32634.1 hypothetical protein DDZ14_09590 [Maritimibacter sp. 55A14]